MRETLAKLKELEKEKRARERAMFGGTIQTASVHKPLEEQAARRAARRAMVLHVLNMLLLPFSLLITALSRSAAVLGGSLRALHSAVAAPTGTSDRQASGGAGGGAAAAKPPPEPEASWKAKVA